MIAEPILEIDEIQGNIIPGFRMPFQYFAGCQVNAQSDLNGFLNYLLPKITTMREALTYKEDRVARAKQAGIRGKESFTLTIEQNLFWINIGFGKKLLGKFKMDAEEVDLAYKLGLAARSSLLGDPSDTTNEGNKKNWKLGNEQNGADIFLIAASDNETTLLKRVEELKAKLTEFALTVIYEENGGRLDEDREHFGFKDGISQPSVRGFVDKERKTLLIDRLVAEGNENPSAPEFAAPGKMLIWPGQFVFGYAKQSPDNYREPEPASENEKSDFLKNGSFLVFRRLKQDVATFNTYSKTMFQQLINTPDFQGEDYETFLAKLVGRFKDGKPVILGEQEVAPENYNNFNFNADTPVFRLRDGKQVASVKADQPGMKCPAFAHIRKVNPRDLPTDLGKETDSATFRIIRRGIPFGKPYDFDNPENPVNETERGLLFLSYQTSIERQFERLTQKWMNEPGRPTAMGYDILVGQNGEEDENGVKWCKFMDDNRQTKEITAEKTFVIPTGGGYFFCPSVSTVRGLIS
ncbi:Dyp-type peroxidase [Pedobacter cryoconitis]|uniref:Dyp-type peroxidase n=1 Tax=Pedobacter cryoconitis TaxID=188932 RepID=UPI001607809E|nr:Dyp-type peroxidase [Pedobacter cryoconitis]MBB5645323.1 Dyp-type peroxidase family [Pedobacter cryoconitis]